MLTKAPKGTKDILPAQTYKWNFVEGVFDEICRKYGFQEIRTPVFEHTELFARGVGDTTDIVEKQMYTFDDYAGRSLTLRPEGTASVVRAFVENKLYAGVQPSKYYYEIPCFRYEKPQSGRLREFHQFGVEVFGSSDMITDAEVISLGADFLAELGIRNVELHINSIGCPDCRPNYRELLKDFLRPKYDELCDTCRGRFDRNPMRILDCKSPVCQELVKGAPMMLDHLCESCSGAFETLKEYLNAFEIDYVVDAGIVRGLDYYTKTAFEFVSGNIGAQGTVCGGGRYDNLICELGGPPAPGVGFGLGIERLLMVAEAEGFKIPAPAGADAFIVCAGTGCKTAGIALLKRLRKAGMHAEMDGMDRNMKGQLKQADRAGARYTLIIGEDELRLNKVSLKDMTSGEQRLVGMHDVEEEIRGGINGRTI
ncbi:MAG: histidine--tRNA ligase [Clostridiales Family XIII bacterium]|jgi:histidyl-tRNA synthetase|nr:histidine--tRNA ligase [Clostridiales Family XIII bacterium]